MSIIKFEPFNKTFNFKDNITILEAVKRADIPLFSSCNGNKTCGECRIQIITQIPPFVDIEEIFFTKKELSEGWRLACIHKISDGMVIKIPDIPKKGKVLVSDMDGIVKIDMDIEKFHIASDFIKQYKGRSSLEIINNSTIGNSKLAVKNYILNVLPCLLETGFTVTIQGNEIIHFEEDDTSGEIYGLAIDIGTTTVAVLLVDLNTGKTKAVEWAMNEQSKHGADVMSRIDFSIKEKNGTETLQKIITGTLNKMIINLQKKTNIKNKHIYKISVAGNTVMQHLLANISPVNLGSYPFRPVFLNNLSIKAKDINLDVNPEAQVLIIPGIGGFVGGDITSVIHMTGLHKKERLSLAVDLGTNGEIVLGSKDKIICGSTAMGPAFEGAQISCGMPAFEGALSGFFIENNDIKYKILGNKNPDGICGSGLVDIIAELLKNKIIDKSGKFNANHNFNTKMTEINKQPAFMIYNSGRKSVYLSQKDVREFQLAKGAVRAGIEILLKQLNTNIENVEKIYIAGAFGNYLSKESLKTVGLFPEFPLEKIQFVGNTASMGAKAALLSGKAEEEMRKISARTEHVSFANDPDFQDIFTESMLF